MLKLTLPELDDFYADLVKHPNVAPSPDRGWGHVGPSRAGHFVKMIHNGIEYGLMEAHAEGFAIPKGAHAFDLDTHQIAEIWRDGSVVRSWSLDLITKATAQNPEMKGLRLGSRLRAG